MTAGQPKKPITADQVYNLAKIGATVAEIAAILHCSPDTINNRFQEELDLGRAEIKTNLRRAQLRLAIEKDNATMLIWLGKQMLNQTDTQNINVNETKQTLSKDFILERLQEKLGPISKDN